MKSVQKNLSLSFQDLEYIISELDTTLIFLEQDLKYNKKDVLLKKKIRELGNFIKKLMKIRTLIDTTHLKFRNPLWDLKMVGPNKPLGYLSLSKIKKMGTTPQSMQKELQKNGLKYLFLKKNECFIIGGAMYVYHEKTLKKLLSKNKKVLEKAGWPTELEKFIRQVANVDAPGKTKLFNLVADAFADYENSGRI